RERVLVDDHEVEEERLYGRNRGDDVWNELAMAFPVDEYRNRSEDRQQEHPEHDRAVQAAPVRRDLVPERLEGLRLLRDVWNREAVGRERVDEAAGRRGHKGGDEVEPADAAFDQPS